MARSVLWLRGSTDAPQSPLFLPVAAMLCIWVVLGGGPPESVFSFGMLALSGSVMLAMVTWRGALASWSQLSWFARITILFFCLLPLAQLVPLPPAIWQALPGRALAVETLATVGMAQQWHPATLSVAATFRSLLIMTWLVPFLLALLQLSSDEVRRIFAVLVLLGALHVALGITQVVLSREILGFYHNVRTPFLNGFFPNKNHSGLFIAFTFLAGYGALYAKNGWHQRHVALIIPAGLILFIALLATFSRAGALFGLAAIIFLVVLASEGRMRLRGGSRYLLIIVPIVASGLLAMIVSTDLASRALSRFGGVTTDVRWSIWQWSWPLVGLYFPFGSGIGSFISVFPPNEQLAWVKPTYVNHVHNDYVEQLIEVGVAAPVGWALVLAMLWRPIGSAWKGRTRQSGRLALIGAAMLIMIALHSALDYPLRRPAIAATSMVALAALLRTGERKSRLRGTAAYANRK